MMWEIDVPSLPFPKPKQLEKLEKIAPSQREAMDPTEMKERIEEIAESLAKACIKNNYTDKGTCEMIIQKALEETGNCMSGKLGNLMVGMSTRAAQTACQTVFEQEEGDAELYH